MLLRHASLIAEGQWLKIRDGNSSTSPLLLTLPSHTPIPGSPHLVFPKDGVTHHVRIKNIVQVSDPKEWQRLRHLEANSEPSWRVESRSNMLRLELHTFVNVTNVTADYPLGFSLLARYSGRHQFILIMTNILAVILEITLQLIPTTPFLLNHFINIILYYYSIFKCGDCFV